MLRIAPACPHQLWITRCTSRHRAVPTCPRQVWITYLMMQDAHGRISLLHRRQPGFELTPFTGNGAFRQSGLINPRGGMRLSVRGLLASPWFGVFFALPTLGVFLPSSARAGCLAHYITSHSGLNGDLTHLERLARTGAITTPYGEAPSERPAPCTGALCSGNPGPPLPTMPSVLAPVEGQWAIPAFPISPVGPDSFECQHVDASRHAVDCSCSIFHPPRFQPPSVHPDDLSR
jgi:hypothetical protein